MRISLLLFTLLVGGAVPTPLLCQVEVDPQQRAAMQAQAEQQTKPAEFVLQHRADLDLTAPQIAAL